MEKLMIITKIMKQVNTASETCATEPFSIFH